MSPVARLLPPQAPPGARRPHLRLARRAVHPEVRSHHTEVSLLQWEAEDTEKCSSVEWHHSNNSETSVPQSSPADVCSLPPSGWSCKPSRVKTHSGTLQQGNTDTSVTNHPYSLINMTNTMRHFTINHNKVSKRLKQLLFFIPYLWHPSLLLMPLYCRLSLNTMTISVGTINVNTGHGVAISVTGIAQVLVTAP